MVRSGGCAQPSPLNLGRSQGGGKKTGSVSKLSNSTPPAHHATQPQTLAQRRALNAVSVLLQLLSCVPEGN